MKIKEATIIRPPADTWGKGIYHRGTSDVTPDDPESFHGFRGGDRVGFLNPQGHLKVGYVHGKGETPGHVKVRAYGRGTSTDHEIHHKKVITGSLISLLPEGASNAPGSPRIDALGEGRPWPYPPAPKTSIGPRTSSKLKSKSKVRYSQAQLNPYQSTLLHKSTDVRDKGLYGPWSKTFQDLVTKKINPKGTVSDSVSVSEAIWTKIPNQGISLRPQGNTGGNVKKQMATDRSYEDTVSRETSVDPLTEESLRDKGWQRIRIGYGRKTWYPKKFECASCKQVLLAKNRRAYNHPERGIEGLHCKECAVKCDATGKGCDHTSYNSSPGGSYTPPTWNDR